MIQRLRTQPTSVRVMEVVEPHDVQPYRHKYAWPSRVWQGSWFYNGYIIRGWLDEVKASDVAKRKWEDYLADEAEAWLFHRQIELLDEAEMEESR